ncbi:MAG: ECF transporter S component [Spirochaetaceae bacterium]|nr:ECF transporter S component [Spirochaetaceae bacterium]
MNNTNSTLSLNKKLTLTGAFSALVIVLGITKLGFITLGAAASITILHIPVILICMLAGLPEGLFVGLVFGSLSLIQAAMSPSGVLDPFFVNPLVSVLPRMLIEVIAWGLWKALNLIPHMPKSVSAGITAFITTVAHTLLVLGSLYVFKGADVREALGGMGYFALVAACGFNAILEAITATVLCAAVFAGLFIAGKKRSKLSQE